MRIGVDLDNVVYPFVSVLGDWVSAVTGRLRAELPDETCWEFYKEQWGYTTAEFLDLYRRAVDNSYLFSQGVPIEGSIDGINELKDLGHTIHFATDRFVGKFAQANTEQWLIANEIHYDSLTYTKDKTIVRADAFIDDKPSNVDDLLKIGCKAYLYDYGRRDQVQYPYPFQHVYSWPEFVERVNAIF
jgi:5'(3')-deoxyribonucleotidase